MAEIDYESETPVYQQIAEWVETYIRDNDLPPGRMVPSEKTIGQEFPGVARTTIRRAVKHLREQGVIYTVPQRGSYVAPPPAQAGTPNT
jgi:DNA-binding GntR family transcriptional regulator